MDPARARRSGRADLLAFYGEVFGWTEGDNTGEPGNPLILYTGAFGEFVYLLPGEPSLTAPASTTSATRSRRWPSSTRSSDARQAYGAHDDRVNVIDVHARTTHGPEHDYTLTSAYIGFVLPLMIELQHLERHDRGTT